MNIDNTLSPSATRVLFCGGGERAKEVVIVLQHTQYIVVELLCFYSKIIKQDIRVCL